MPSKPCSRCQDHVQTRYAPKTTRVTVVRMHAYDRLRALALAAASGVSAALWSMLLLAPDPCGRRAVLEDAPLVFLDPGPWRAALEVDAPVPTCAATIGSGGRVLLLLEERGMVPGGGAG